MTTSTSAASLSRTIGLMMARAKSAASVSGARDVERLATGPVRASRAQWCWRDARCNPCTPLRFMRTSTAARTSMVASRSVQSAIGVTASPRVTATEEPVVRSAHNSIDANTSRNGGAQLAPQRERRRESARILRRRQDQRRRTAASLLRLRSRGPLACCSRGLQRGILQVWRAHHAARRDDEVAGTVSARSTACVC